MASSSSIPNFDADAVRAGIRLAMQVGLQISSTDQPTFYMPVTVTGDGTHALDANGVPFSASYTPTKSTRVTHQVPCAVEYHDGDGKIASFGIMVPAKVVLTLLDEDYAVIKGFEYVVISGNRYFYSRTQPQVGLVDVGVWTIHCLSEDEG